MPDKTTQVPLCSPIGKLEEVLWIIQENFRDLLNSGLVS